MTTVNKVPLGDKEHIASTLKSVAQVRLHQGDYERARIGVEECLTLQRDLGNTGAIGVSLHLLGQVALYPGQYARAQELTEECLALFRAARDQLCMAGALLQLGQIAVEQEDHERARQMFVEILVQCQRLDDKICTIECLEGLARVNLLCECPVQAARLLGAGEALREAIAWPVPLIDRPWYERLMGLLRSRLDEVVFTVAWSEGRSLPLEHAIAEALHQA